MKQELFKYLLFLYRSLEIQAQRSLSYRLRPLLFLTLLCFFMSMFGILFREYRFFCAESQKIIILQQQYRKYLAMVKKNMGEALKSNLSIEALASSKKKTENYNKIITENYTSLN
ncbi:MAG: hypothetical protein WCD44_01510, partial [Candidatus Babeliales bacterium]